MDAVDVLLGLIVVMAVTVNMAKIAQAAKQFYPERCGKACEEKMAEIGLAAIIQRRGMRSGFAG